MRVPFRKDQGAPPLPREVEPVPMTQERAAIHAMEANAYVPPRHREIDDERERYAGGLQAYDAMRTEVAALKVQLADTNEIIRQKHDELSRLEAALAQAKNDFDNSLITAQRAVHAATDLRGLVSNLKAAIPHMAAALVAMIDNFEVAEPIAPSTARKKKKNGEPLMPRPEAVADALAGAATVLKADIDGTDQDQERS